MERVEVSADEIAERMTAERIAREERHVREHEDRAETDAEVAVEVEREDRVPPQEDEERGREDKGITVQVLDEERESRLAGVALARVRDRAGRRRPEERAVIGAAVVVASHPERQRERDDEDCRREVPIRPDERQCRVYAVRAETGRVERREIGLEVIVRSDQAGVDGVEDKEPEDDDDDRRLEPPKILALLRPMTDVDRARRHHDRWWASPAQNAKVSRR